MVLGEVSMAPIVFFFFKSLIIEECEACVSLPVLWLSERIVMIQLVLESLSILGSLRRLPETLKILQWSLKKI